MKGTRWLWVAAWVICVASGCIAPDERRPGLWLPGEAAAPPSDWSFTDAHKEIALEVATPYLLAHSVTIWCVAVDGELFIGARDPDDKNWPGWVGSKPDVRLGIDAKIYEGALAELEDAETIRMLQNAYAAKYELPPRTSGEGPPMRYWRVDSREG
jgi:hypothetical protein